MLTFADYYFHYVIQTEIFLANTCGLPNGGMLPTKKDKALNMIQGMSELT